MSHNMSNKEVISVCRQHKKNVTALKASTFFLESLEKEIATLTERVEAAEDVSYIHKGVPMEEIGISGRYSIFPVSDTMERYADIYRNAHNNRTWGLNLRHYGYDVGGEWMGAKWKTKKACVEAAKEWIATGTEPEFNGGQS